MIAVLSALLLLQGLVTVGDTVWVETRVPLPARMIVRPQPWDLGELGLVLGPAQVELGPDSAAIRYPLVLWYPGDHQLRLPGPIVVSPEGQSDTLPTRTLTVRVASVLPAGARRDTLDPMPAAALVPQAGRSLLAVVALELVVGLLVGAVALGWRRRERRRRATVPNPTVAPLRDLSGTLATWAQAGELRAAVDGWAHRAEAWYPDPAGRPAEVAAWLDAAELAGFTDRTASAELERLLHGTASLPAPAGEGA